MDIASEVILLILVAHARVRITVPTIGSVIYLSGPLVVMMVLLEIKLAWIRARLRPIIHLLIIQMFRMHLMELL